MTINISTTPTAVAKLLITKEVDLMGTMPCNQSKAVLDALLSLPIDDILTIIDATEDRVVDSTTIPQFGSIEALIEVPKILSQMGGGAMNYPQLGFQLKKDLGASLDANTKFGENHGKGSALLGISNCVDRRFTLSALSSGFVSYNNSSIQTEIVIRLFFTIPIIQEILKRAKNQQYNGFDAMSLLKETTKKRRSQCLRKIFKAMETFNNPSLNKRLNNIVWVI